MASLANVEHRNQEATVYVGNLDPLCDEDLLLELFTQIGRVNSVHMPKDKLTNQHNGYGFVEFLDVTDADYAIQIMSMISLHQKPIRVSKSSLDKKTPGSTMDVGANLFIGNLDPTDVDEKLLFDTFSAFGTITRPPKIMRDAMTNQSKGYGFVSYDSFEASDMAIECMNEQYLANRQITVQYAFKKSTSGDSETTGQAPGTKAERHGSRAERMLAANQAAANAALNKLNGSTRRIQRTPNIHFATSNHMAHGGAPHGMMIPGQNNSMPPPPPPPLPPPSFGGPPPPPPPLPPGMPPPRMMHQGMLPPPPPPPLPPSLPPSMNTGQHQQQVQPPLPPMPPPPS
jgi:splicing factor 3B subunit 4